MYSTQQARSDIDSVYSMALFDDVNILPQPAEDSTLEHPKVRARPASRARAYVVVLRKIQAGVVSAAGQHA